MEQLSKRDVREMLEKLEYELDSIPKLEKIEKMISSTSLETPF
jgi:hypothetical protein